MTALVDLLLAIQGQMITILGDQDLRQESRRGDAAFVQAFGQGSNYILSIFIVTRHVFAPDQSAAKEPSRLIVELLADFGSNIAPGLRRSFDRFRINDFFNHWNARWPARLFAST